MSKIPTAEEFFNNFCNKRTRVGQLNDTERLEVMIEFAKLHVEAALKQAAEKAYFRDFNDYICRSDENRQSILKSYSVSNIK